jgi:Replication-relaxation
MTPGIYHTRQRAQRIREKLTSLDMTLLETLTTVTYATTRQLEELALPSRSGPARARRIRRRLTHLERLAVVYQLRRQVGGLGGGSLASVWTAERTGYTLVKASAPHRDLRPARERGRAFLRHGVAVTQHLVDVHRQARRSGACVVSWVAEPASRIPYRDPTTGRLAYLTPDAICEVRTPAEQLVSALEVDMGSEGRTSLQRKAARYIAYAARHPEAPQVVWSFTTRERATMFSKAVTRTFRQGAVQALLARGLFVVTVHDRAAAALCGEEPT